MKAPKKTGEDHVRQFTVQHDDNDVRLDRWFKRHLPDVGFATVSRWARTGQIRVDGKRADVDTRLLKGQVLRVPPGGALIPGIKGQRVRKPLTDAQIELAESMVLEKDRAAIILNKPPGLATQGGTGTFEHVDGLLDAFVGETDARPRLVHRLDKDTSGVLLVARSANSAAFFSKRFSGRTARKIYWALIVGIPEIKDGMIELPISKQPGTGGEKMMVDESGEGQSARTRYRVIGRAGNSTAWVELQPLTGRTHQLRVHMAAIGHPIVGDGKYGGQGAFLTGSISRKMHLHARRLRIEHPEGDLIDVSAPLPEHFAASMAQLGFHEEDGDLAIDPIKPIPEKTMQKRAAKAHSKEYRKERRGERRKRADGTSVAAGGGGRKPTGKRAAAGALLAKGPAKADSRGAPKSAGRTSAKPDGKAPARKSAAPRAPAGTDKAPARSAAPRSAAPKSAPRSAAPRSTGPKSGPARPKAPPRDKPR
ncbi:23S rRNA pseudouridine955/2504/2580 synthase [Novosphingobium hassiacum]|uniref:23S rRNA pseudouridine955/2504/2580 synthase n=1 Tax=Novosphingobium hassiacum TaxID=173676 RepID=A0A7W6EX47_9SPHN|nr:RluA family pseudouridine synthase [Novosphingobium hassiacum]MBB3861680.1 23S rRNA pseudouridine955/2504/2580 synthase [Novosphingobium hassiacum]